MAASSNYNLTPEMLFEKTNGGLDIIHKYLPGSIGAENKTKKFKVREEEKTASATLFLKDNIWFVVDHGGKSFTAITLVMDLTGTDFKTTFFALCGEFNLAEKNTFFKAEIVVKENTELPLDYFKITFKNIPTNLNVVGRFLDNDIATEYNFFEVESYEKVIIKKESKKPALIIVTATNDYPIFAYTDNPEIWAKLYCPRDTKYKHSYLGEKPERYVHGLKQFLQKCKPTQDLIVHESKKGKDADVLLIEALTKELREQKVFIATGGSDGLNLASLNNEYNLIWFNSESEQISYKELKQIRKITNLVYNLPDIDKPGKKYAYEVAKENWTLKTIWLPSEKMVANGKDFRDWLAFYRNSDKETIVKQFENLIAGSLQCKFFDTVVQKNKLEKHNINLSNLHYFLNAHNFYTYVLEHKNIDVAADDQIIFIRIEGNIVYKVSPRDIRRFCLAYVREKGQDLKVSNMILSTPYFNENHLLGLANLKLNFKNNDADTQYFFFNNQVAKITASAVELKKHGSFENYAWNKQIIDHTVSTEKPFFEYEKDALGNDSVKILRTDCQFQNYLINASRTFWRKDLETSFENELVAAKYHEENKFNLEGKNLNEEEQIIQKKHFLNKCFSIGYILHRYKQESFAKCLYVMDDTPKDQDEDANGGTGKSVMFRGVDKLLQNRFLVDGKNKSITLDRHIFHGLYETSEYIQVDDADQYLDFKFFFTKITNSIVVNPKNGQPYEIPFDDAPKIAWITNYGMPNITGSDLRRILFVSFSDYYHAKTDLYKQERRISHDFDNKDLFKSWDSKEWNRFYNFMMQCCQLYLQNRGNEFQAPDENITLTNQRAGMGQSFEEWADSYFQDDKLNVKLIKKEVYDDYKEDVNNIKYTKSANGFKKALQLYCNIKNFKLNPPSMQNNQGRVIENNYFDKKKQKITTVEALYIETSEEVATEILQNKEVGAIVPDDMPF